LYGSMISELNVVAPTSRTVSAPAMLLTWVAKSAPIQIAKARMAAFLE